MILQQYAEVLVDVANRRFDQSYHYLIPEKLQIKVGMKVIVILKNRRVQGLVVRISDKPPELDENIKLRPIDGVLEDQSLIPGELIELASWLAETTICPVAQALHAVWPFLKGKAEQWVIPMAEMEDEDVKVLKLLDPETYTVLATLHRARRGGLPEPVLLKRADVKQSLLEEMQKQGWIRKELRFTKKKESQSDGNIFLRQQDGAMPVDSVIYSWADHTIELSPNQKKVSQKIWNAYQKKDGGTILLHGVTGSGKTEIYRDLVTKTLSEGHDVIILVPEISLTSQISKFFLEQFGDLVGVIHSGINTNEKLAIWEMILRGEKRIIIGARSAVFAPLPNLKLIIIDEEHDNAYKQDENPKYHTREVARKRMIQRNGLVLLGSATPSLETYAAAQRGQIDLISLNERFNKRAMPMVEIVDMKKELAGGNKSIFSYRLQSKLRDRIEKGEQSILFLNRRGYSTFVFCRECGFVANCPHCDVSLTFHNNKQKLCCHYCDYQEDVVNRCPECGSKYIRFFGQGTQKVEEEVQTLFPGVEVLRLDTDTTSGLGKHKEILERFRKERVPILVGTQMLAKGLDFHDVTLVGVISADQLLNMPDFRSRERTFQLLTQVAGRAGRGAKQGDVVIQTYSPEDRAIVRASSQDYPAFFWEEISYRKQQSYPPFSHLIRVLIYHEKEERVMKAAHELADCLKISISAEEKETYHILGPAPAVLTKLKNEYRWQISIKGKRPETLRKIAHAGVKEFYNRSFSSGINLSIEVNPLSN